MSITRKTFLASAVAALAAAAPPHAAAQLAAPLSFAQAVERMQGEWISRYPGDATTVRLAGQRLTVVSIAAPANTTPPTHFLLANDPMFEFTALLASYVVGEMNSYNFGGTSFGRNRAPGSPLDSATGGRMAFTTGHVDRRTGAPIIYDSLGDFLRPDAKRQLRL